MGGAAPQVGALHLVAPAVRQRCPSPAHVDNADADAERVSRTANAHGYDPTQSRHACTLFTLIDAMHACMHAVDVFIIDITYQYIHVYIHV